MKTFTPLFLFCFISFFTLTALANPPLSMTAVDMVQIDGETVIGDAFGASTLIRDRQGATGTVAISDLEAGIVYSVWALAFNNPNECVSVPCNPGTDGQTADLSLFWAAGGIADPNGVLNLRFRLERGRPAGFVEPSFSPNGLTNVKGAEVHFAMVAHFEAEAGNVAVPMTTPGPASRGAVHVAQ